MSQNEILRGQARRRWSVGAKRRLVAETLIPGSTVHAVAQRHGVNSSQLFTWRKRFRADLGLAPTEPSAPAFTAVELVAVPGATQTSNEAMAAADAPTSGLGA
jgi:transposase-like protein